jgi:hypothetical protein
MTFMNSDSESTNLEILKTDVIGRVQRSREEVNAILDAFEASAMSGAEFARHHGLNYATFASWRTRRRKELAAPSSKSAAKDTAFTFLEVTTDRPSQNSLTIEIADQIKIQVANPAQAKIASTLIKELIGA